MDFRIPGFLGLSCLVVKFQNRLWKSAGNYQRRGTPLPIRCRLVHATRAVRGRRMAHYITLRRIKNRTVRGADMVYLRS